MKRGVFLQVLVQEPVVAYNVSFGDAILICISERSGQKTVMRHVLIDVGNLLQVPVGAAVEIRFDD